MIFWTLLILLVAILVTGSNVAVEFVDPIILNCMLKKLAVRTFWLIALEGKR